MKIVEVNFGEIKDNGLSIFSDIYQRKVSGYVIRNFFGEEELKLLKEVFQAYPGEYFEPYDGFYSLPRPFNFIFNTSKTDLDSEARYIYKELEDRGIRSRFNERLSKLSADMDIDYSNPSGISTFSRTWSALRELKPNKGMFEIHCGRLFQGANNVFYNYFRQVADVDVQMTFLMIVQKPETVTSDIDVYEAHWEEVDKKLDSDTLQSNQGVAMPLSEIPCNHVQLEPGDVLIFDEGNYWHAVPEFSGAQSRLSFGGFITKYRYEDKVMVWV